MSQAPLLDTDDVHHETMTVLRARGEGWRVGNSARQLEAQVATSCLVVPEAKDRVLVASRAGGGAWILAVLERARSEEPLVLEADGDVTLRSRTGRVSLDGEAGVTVSTPGELMVAAGRVGLRALEARLAVDATEVVGRTLHSSLERIKLAAKTVDQVVDRWTQRLGRSLRTVDDLDRVKAGHLDRVADHTFSVRSDHAVVTAERLVKVDGKQVHIG